MNKVLIITSAESERKQDMVRRMTEIIGDQNCKFVLCLITDIAIQIDNNKTTVFALDEDISSYDLVYFRGIKRTNFLYASTVALCLKANNINFLDTAYANVGVSKTKITSLVQLALSGAPVPQTLYLAQTPKRRDFEYISTKVGSPFIAKELSQQRGKGVYLVKNQEDLDALPTNNELGENNEYLFQKLIDKDHEYRILVLGDSIGVLEEKIATTEGEFRNNVSLGAEEVFMDPLETPQNLADVAKLAARALDLQVAGVDVMTERDTGKVYLLEVNRGPGLTYTDDSPEFTALANYLYQTSKK